MFGKRLREESPNIPPPVTPAEEVPLFGRKLVGVPPPGAGGTEYGGGSAPMQDAPMFGRKIPSVGKLISFVIFSKNQS